MSALPAWLPPLLALLGLALAGAVLAHRLFGLTLEPATRRVRLAFRELGERTGDLVAEFLDWLRLGR